MPVRDLILFGDVRRACLSLALPSLGAMLFCGAGTLCDALLLARMGSLAAAAAALSFPILTMMQAVGFTLGMGAGAAVSRMLGSGDSSGAADVAALGLQSAVVLAALLCAPAFVFVRPLLSLLAAGRDVPPGACAYARWMLCAGPVMCASLVLSSLLRAQGETAANLPAFGTGAVSGVCAQVLLMRLGMGVPAAGAALLVREGVTLAALILYIWKKQPAVRPSLRPKMPRLSMYKEIMRSGLPTLLRQGLFAVSGAMLTRTAAAFGQDALSGMGLAVRAGALLSSGIIGFGQGFSPVCGVCFGAGDMQRIKAAYRFCMKALCLSLCAVGLLTALFARRILLAFGADASVAAIGSGALIVTGLALPMQGAVTLASMLTQAMGLTVRAALTGASRQGYALMLMLMILPRMFGLPGLILAQGAADALSLAVCLLLTRGVLPGDRQRLLAIGFPNA